MDELLGRRAPYSAEAEQAVLGSMLIDPSCIPDVVGSVKAEDFYVQANRDIFETVFAMFSFGQTVDPVTVLDQMKSRGVLKDNSRQYLLELMQITPTAANVLEYAAIVRDRALLRALAAVGEDITNSVYSGAGQADSLLENAERKIYALSRDRDTGGLTPVASVVQRVFDAISEAAESDSAIPGEATGLGDLDRAILGLNGGDLVIIAARPGMGKTSIALNIARHVGKTSGKTVAVFSLEMSREQLVTRLLSSEALVDGKKLQTGRLNDEEWRRIASASSVLSATDIRIDDNPSLTVAAMNAQCRRLKNLGLVVIDYLQLMQSAGSDNSWSNESRVQAVSDISRMMKIMAKELNVPVLCLSQLSRASTKRPDKRPQLSDLRESGAIEQDADVVVALHREGYYDEAYENPNEVELIILKNRRGETGKLYMMWLPEYTSFAPLDRRHEE